MNENQGRQTNRRLLFIIPIVVGVLFGLWCMGVFD